MTIDELKQDLQAHFTDRMVTIIGSGLSAALGLPTMDDLASALLNKLPGLLSISSAAKWNPIADLLRSGTDLETSLSGCDDEDLNDRIRDVVSEEVGTAEGAALKGLFTGTIRSPFARLLKHLTFSTGRAEIITPNYDRLIEFAAEINGFGVDTTFSGSAFGKYDPRLSKDSLSEFASGKPGRNPIQRRFRAHIAIYKPHGSLDWYLRDGEPVRCAYGIDAPRLMITPGANKFRLGYNSPFDMHRESANRAIDNASRFLIVGYGFNDEQLEQHLRTQLKLGRPALLLTRSLTTNAEQLISQCPSVRALCHFTDGKVTGTQLLSGCRRILFPSIELWDLNTFATEVFGA